ncbi:uncharacterized protein CEXT_112341 [Caerostris extrusa]|uniref:GRAM domain-containing protein n=1 Tax=Caerostris extrusa TaxID=172846 RepID=A0AAV4WHI7_CAEEX|nr:uncharacterized protein CEXT_112341 [Caerostris extrusa]
MLPNELFGRIIDNFTRTTKEASVQCELESEKIYFEKLHKRYSKPVHAKENTDVRLGYRVDTNTFLVKAYFTFGVRTVVANTSHIIQTTVAGMLFYRVPEGFYANEDVPEGSFLYEDQFLYEKFVLQSHSAYCVPSGTRYIAMTYKNFIFYTRRGGRCSVTIGIESTISHTDHQQQNVSTDSQQQQPSPSYLASNEMNQFLQVSGEIEEMIGCFSRPSLQIPDLDRYKTIMEPNTLEYFKDKFDKIIQEYHLVMNEMSIYTF